MNFEFSEEQLFIRDQARNFLSQESYARRGAQRAGYRRSLPA